jgi:hypothetical protein
MKRPIKSNPLRLLASLACSSQIQQEVSEREVFLQYQLEGNKEKR